jgi:hypothetical protein
MKESMLMWGDMARKLPKKGKRLSDKLENRAKFAVFLINR